MTVVFKFLTETNNLVLSYKAHCSKVSLGFNIRYRESR